MDPNANEAMTTDLLVLLVLVLAFAGLVTIHVALAFRLSRRGPPWRGLLALLVPPLAPAWGFFAGLRTLSVLWLVAAGTYLMALGMATF